MTDNTHLLIWDIEMVRRYGTGLLQQVSDLSRNLTGPPVEVERLVEDA